MERWPSLQFAVQLDTDAVLHVAEEGGIEAVFEALRTRSLAHLAHRGATPDDTAVEVARSQVNATVITSLARSCGLPPGLCNENRHVANLHCACIMLWRLDAHGRELLRRWMSEVATPNTLLHVRAEPKSLAPSLPCAPNPAPPFPMSVARRPGAALPRRRLLHEGAGCLQPRRQG